jgi:non-heme chloroperoxidase
VEPDVNIYVEDVNRKNRKTILFIHGWPANHKLFEYQFNILPAMGYRCIGMDLRGFGKSDKPWEGYSYDRLHTIEEGVFFREMINFYKILTEQQYGKHYL